MHILPKRSTQPIMQRHAVARGLMRCISRSWVHSKNNIKVSQRQLTQAASSGGDPQQIQPPDVPQLARMAHIAVTEDEVKDWAPKIEGIVEWFGQLQEVDVEGVPPALRAEVETENFLRQDSPRQYEQRDELVQGFPLTEGRFLKVPKIATAADN